ncbi:MAG: hypothetical protein ACJ73E_09275 [Mycobacteriales bacterium]
MRRTLTLVLLVLAALLGLAGPADARTVYNARWGVDSDTYNHYRNPARGEARGDTWVDEQYSDVEPYIERVRGFARAVRVARVARIQIDVVRLEDQNSTVWARNATPVNSGTNATAIQTTAWVNAGDEFGFPYSCDSTRLTPLRTRAAISIRWTDGTLSRVTALSQFSESEFCRRA